jgi:hypothetical protein
MQQVGFVQCQLSGCPDFTGHVYGDDICNWVVAGAQGRSVDTPMLF